MRNEETATDILFRILRDNGGRIEFQRDEIYFSQCPIHEIYIGPTFKWICTHYLTAADAIAECIAGYYNYLKDGKK